MREPRTTTPRRGRCSSRSQRCSPTRRLGQPICASLTGSTRSEYWVDAFRGWTDSKERSQTEAARWAERAIKHTNSNGLAHIVLASIHLLKRRHDEALADCYKAVELRPNCPTANSYLANVLHYCGRPAEAITKVKEAIRITPVYPPWYMSLLAAAYRESGPGAVDRRRQARRPAQPDRPRAAVELMQRLRAYRPVAASTSGGAGDCRDRPDILDGQYVEGQPYKEDRTLQQLADSLREAGLPE